MKRAILTVYLFGLVTIGLTGDTVDPWNPPKKPMAWAGVLHSHTNAQWNAEHHRILVMTWFPADDALVTRKCFVTAERKAVSYTDMFMWSIRATHTKVLSEEEMDEVRATVAKLPPTADVSSTNRLVLVSFSADSGWQTRRYDRGSLPPTVSRLYVITEAKMEELENPEPAPGHVPSKAAADGGL